MAEECIEYVIAGIPPEVDRSLRERAALRKQGLNEVVVDELSSHHPPAEGIRLFRFGGEMGS